MNYYLIICTIIFFGIFGGIVNAIRTNSSYIKSIIKGVAAAFLVPVFLDIIKSNLGRNLAENLYDYMIFGGLTLVSAIFSDKFIDTIGDKILQKVQNAEKKAEESNQKANTIIEKDAEPDEGNKEITSRISKFKEANIESTNTKVDIIISSLNNKKYKYRTLTGISKETKLNSTTVRKLLTDLDEKDIVMKINSGKRTLWTLNY